MPATRFFLIVLICGSGFFMATSLDAQEYPDLSIWAGKWFKVTLTSRVFYFPGPGVSPSICDESNKRFIRIVGWNPESKELSCEIYKKDGEGESFTLRYFGGAETDFTAWNAQGSDDNVIAIVVRITGTMTKKGKLKEWFIRTIGAIELETAEDSSERRAKKLTIEGQMIPEDKIPFPIPKVPAGR